MNLASTDILIQVPSFVFWKDLNSRYLGCSSTLAKAAGFHSVAEIIGKTDYDLVWHMHAASYQQGDQEAFDGLSKYNCLESQLKADGTLVNILVNKKPLYDKAGQLIGVVGSYVETKADNYAPKNEPTKKHISLTKKQLTCLVHIAKGLTAKQIGFELGLSMRTVENYINTLKFKFQCDSKSSLIKKAWEHDFIKARLYEELK